MHFLRPIIPHPSRIGGWGLWPRAWGTDKMNRRDFVSMTGAWMAGAVVPRPQPLAPSPSQFVERWSWVMGQAVHVMVFAETEDAGLEACALALAELRRVEDRLTLFADASDLCELNRHAGRGPMRVAPDLREILRGAEALRAQTHGACNAAVEPLMRAWGFRHPRRSAPTEGEIAAAREAVTAALVQLDGDMVSLPNAHTQLDFGGIGVGYGIDCAIAILRGLRIQRAFIDISGDCYGLGAPPDEPEGWVVEIAGTSRTVRLRDAALATSANSQSVVRWGEQVAGHIMNPATGYPATSQRQVSVAARTATAADALSTASLVSGRS